MVKFTAENLYHYFAVAGEQDSVLLVGQKLFDFVDRGSNTLIVTIGDSWTWGADLTNCDVGVVHVQRRADDEFRIQNVYGNVMAAAIHADFLNLGESGSGNWYIARKLKELLNIHQQLSYQKILVVGVWTEVGRDLNSSHDIDIDYRTWLLDNVRSWDDYYDFMKFIQNVIALKISHTISQFDDRFRFVFSTNFVDPIGIEALSPYWIDQNWLGIICSSLGRKYDPSKCYTVSPWVIEKFAMVFDVAPELDKLEWLKWINEISDHANLRAAVCQRDDVNFGNLLHPLAHNHRAWAHYLLEQIHA